MAAKREEVSVGRIIACFAPGGGLAPRTLARLAGEMRAELLGLFIEDVELLRFASLPFAVEVGFPSAARRTLDVAAVERALRDQAAALRRALAASLGERAWSLRVARGAPADAVAAALAEGHAPALLIPPRANLHAERRVLRRSELADEELSALMAAARPALILPE
jgi:hypothetical protein